MRKVANRKIIRRLAVRNVIVNRRKYIPVIAAILLTTTLFTALFSIGMSIVKTTQQSTMRQVGGSSMAGLKYALEEDYERLRADAKVRDISYRVVVGILTNKELADSMTEVYYATDDNAKDMFCYPTTGRMPQTEDEVALSQITLERLGVEAKLGQKVLLEIAQGNFADTSTIQKEFTLCGYWEGDPVAMSQLCFVSRDYQKLVAADATQEYESTDKLDTTGYWMIDFNFRSSFNIEGKLLALLERCGYDVNKVNYGINWAYGFSEVDISSLLILGFLILLILLAGYLIIYNIFYLNVTADIHAYGLLKTIGTSGRQLFRMIRIQAMLLSIIGIPLGLLVGTAVGKCMLPYIVQTLSVEAQDLTFSISPLIYLFAILFSALTVWIGCKKPGKMARNVSAIEAVGYTESRHNHKKNKATKKVTPFTMAAANLGREKKKVIVVVLSLSLSVMLVNGIYSIVQGLDSKKFVSTSILGDFCVQDVAANNVSMMLDEHTIVDEQSLEVLGSLEGVEEQSNVYHLGALAVLNERARQMVDEVLQASGEAMYMEADAETETLRYDVYGIDEWMYRQIAITDGKADWDKFESGEYAIISSYEMLNSGNENFPLYGVGDEIVLNFPDGTTKHYDIMAVGSMPYVATTKMYYMIGGMVMLPQEEVLAHMDEKGALYSILNVDSNEQQSIEAQIQAYVEQSDSLCVVSRQTYLDEFENFVRMFEIVGGALVVILALIGILNFTNAIITSILRRKRELAMMEAVGMTKRQMNAMLVWEGVFYGLLTTVAALVLNLLVGGVCIKALVGGVWFFNYRMTFVPILICLPFLLLIAAVIPYAAGKRLAKKSVIERMRG